VTPTHLRSLLQRASRADQQQRSTSPIGIAAQGLSTSASATVVTRIEQTATTVTVQTTVLMVFVLCLLAAGHDLASAVISSAALSWAASQAGSQSPRPWITGLPRATRR
jgi:hypothetical protein